MKFDTGINYTYSHCVTSFRNQLLYWYSNLIILPVYMLCFHILINYSVNNIFITPPGFLPAIFWIIILLPPSLALFAPSYWHRGFRNRSIPILSSIFIVVILLLDTPSMLLDLNIFIAMWMLITICLFIYSLPKRTFVLSLLISFAGLILAITITLPSLFNEFNYPKNEIIICIFIITLVGIGAIYSIHQLLYLWRSGYYQAYPDKFWAMRLIGATLLMIGAVLVRLEIELHWQALWGLVLLFFSFQFPNFISRQYANLRMLMKPVRHDRLIDLASPIISPNHIINRVLLRWLPRLLKVSNRRFILNAVFFFGGIVIPLAELLRPGGERDILRLMLLGIVSAVILSVFYVLIWLLNNRRSYIVSRFESEVYPIVKTAK